MTRPGESDVGQDDAQALSRPQGGEPSGGDDDEVSVGRGGGQDEGYAGETGAERRAQAD